MNDPEVPTAAVEDPVVRIMGEEPGGRRVSRRILAIVAVVGALFVGGVGVYGQTLNQELATTRTQLATTEAGLATTTSGLDLTTGQLGETTMTLAATTAEREGLDGQIERLAAQVATQTECVALQTAALDELGRISDLETQNFNRTAGDSTWAKSETKRNKAVDAALDAYYQAYSRAFQGSTTSARTSAASGAAAETTIAAQEEQQQAELALIDRSAAEISTALDALEQQLATTETACKDVAP